MPKPKGPPYLAFELDALPKSDLAAMSVGLDEGVSARALLRIWEYAWREQVEWVRPEVVLGCCKGNERLAGALTAAAYGFLEPVPAGWTSEPCTPEPIPVAGYRVRGARRYLRIGSPQSKGGHAAKGNLIPGARYRRPAETAESEGATNEPKLSAASRLPLGCPSAEVSADSRHQRAATIDDRASKNREDLEALAGDPPAPPVQQELVSGPTVDDLRAAWNELTTPPLPRWAKTPKDRARAAANALKRRPLEEWREVFRRIEASAFCRGATDRGSWVADVDWALRPSGVKPEPAAKVLEGRFDSAEQRAPPAPICEACGERAAEINEHGHNICDRCRYRRFGELVESGYEWTPGVTEEQEENMVKQWIERERAQRGVA